jgi:hypothetical protein
LCFSSSAVARSRILSRISSSPIIHGGVGLLPESQLNTSSIPRATGNDLRRHIKLGLRRRKNRFKLSSRAIGSQRPRYDHMRHKCLDIAARW